MIAVWESDISDTLNFLALWMVKNSNSQIFHDWQGWVNQNSTNLELYYINSFLGYRNLMIKICFLPLPRTREVTDLSEHALTDIPLSRSQAYVLILW